MSMIPTPQQRIVARRVAQTLLVNAIKSGATQNGEWAGSPEHILRTALLDADYRDGFPDSYPQFEVDAARRLIISVADDALEAGLVK